MQPDTVTIISTPETKSAPSDSIVIESPDGAFLMWSRRNLRIAVADAINDARRTVLK